MHQHLKETGKRVIYFEISAYIKIQDKVMGQNLSVPMSSTVKWG